MTILAWRWKFWNFSEFTRIGCDRRKNDFGLVYTLVTVVGKHKNVARYKSENNDVDKKWRACNLKQNGNSILAKINQNQSHETGGTIFKSIITHRASSWSSANSVGTDGQMVRENCHDWLSTEWKTDHVRKNIGQLNAIIERKEMNVKFGFDAGPNLLQKMDQFWSKTIPDVRDNGWPWFDSIVHVQAAITQVIK